MPINVWGEITFRCLNINGAAVEVWEWISNCNPHFLMLVKGGIFLEYFVNAVEADQEAIIFTMSDDTRVFVFHEKGFRPPV